ncbi:glycosyltransferase family 39 protein [Pararhodospirillum oryzae]|uniref:Glycosyltransferase RgtA/B/C/D-like domain-containing protein n=1 Tax=Pararhodospirillum oryzae TaxID=478448 RepID=A0A512H3M8_9PROT|nr:glycosyltransferase family 39 protein [Pararhodospirillum oryzae]GEO80069.1 hypothetical protein ROR02_02000 [Pararhodospirillum oryzae]
MERAALALAVLVPVTALLIQGGAWTGGRNDDAELLLHGQTLALAYDALNPPLVAWISWAFQQVLGPTLWAVRLPITLALIATAGLAGALARRLSPDPLVRALGTLAPFTLLHQGFYVSLNLSHSVFLTLGALAALVALIAATDRPTPGRFIVLGLVAGLALLTKYNAVVVLAALGLAGLAVEPVRRAIWGWKGMLAGLVAALVAGPVYGALALHPEGFAHLYQAKMGLSAPQPWPAGVGAGVLSVLSHGFSVLLPGAGLALVVFLPGVARRIRAQRRFVLGPEGEAAWPWRLAVLMPTLYAGLLAGVALIGQSRGYSAHHLLPVGLAMVPLVVALASQPPAGRAERILFLSLSLALAGAAPVALAHFTWRTAATCTGKCNIVLPYGDYARGLRGAGFTGGTVVQLTSVHALPLANLRAWFPDSRFVRPLDPQARVFVPPPRDPPGDCVVLWDPAVPPAPTPEALARALGLDPGELAGGHQGVVSGPLALSGRPGPTLAYALLPGAGARCP